MPGMDFAAHGLLDGLDGDARTQREHLLRRLLDEGYTLQELTRAVQEDRLALLPVDRVFGGTLTAAEIEERTGLPASTALRIRRLQGLPAASPDDRAFNDDDVDAARSVKLFLDAGFDEDRIVEITQVL